MRTSRPLVVTVWLVVLASTVPGAAEPPTAIFADGFESANVLAWTVPCAETSWCGTGAYCAREDAWCDAERGLCTEQPADCSTFWDPVCACSGTTYGNACLAAYYGESLIAAGSCTGEPCTDNTGCGVGEYCTKPVGLCAATGQCAEMPLSCTPLYVPVCGCDLATYGNDCYAAQAGVSVALTGTCPS